MSFNPKLSFLRNIEHGLIINNKTLDDLVKNLESTTQAIKTRLYHINQTKTIASPLDRRICDYLLQWCVGFDTYKKTLKDG